MRPHVVGFGSRLRGAPFVLALAALLFVPGSSFGQTPDGETPAEETPCEGLTGAAFGLCNAFCEAQDCDVHYRASCDQLRRNYEKKTGESTFPCETACDCGDGICDPACVEDSTSCPADCCDCGDGVCDPACLEDSASCPADCCDCGDGVCDPACQEDGASCPADCCECGDGFCDPACGETDESCAADCGCAATGATAPCNSTVAPGHCTCGPDCPFNGECCADACDVCGNCPTN